MTEIPLGLWALIGSGVVVSCLVAADAIGRSQGDKPLPGTTEDPAVKRMEDKQRAYGVYLRKKGRSILNKSKPYTPSIESAPSLRPHAELRMIRGGKR